MSANKLFKEGVSLHKTNQLAEAETCYRAVLTENPAHSDCLHQLGALLVQKHGKSQYQEALRMVKAAIQLAPANAKYRRSLGIVHEAAEQWMPAADAYERAIEKQPDDLQSYMRLAKVLKAADKLARAAEAYKAAIRLQPDNATAHYKLASVLKQLGKHHAAAQHYREVVRIDPSNDLAAFWAIALDSTAAPVAACPASLVKNLFDGYAENFDSHLVDKLHYKTPSTLMDCVWEAAAAAATEGLVKREGQRWCRCIDLGCGTGLMGPLLRPHCEYLCGVDLSAGMVDKARQRGCYDDLAVGELTEYLEGLKQGGAAAFDLLVAADVFVYIGELLPVLNAAAAVAAEGALFAFSTELHGKTANAEALCGSLPTSRSSSSSSSTGTQPNGTAAATATDSDQQQPDGIQSSSGSSTNGSESIALQPTGYRLQATGRYAHSQAYLKETAAASGWQVVLMREAVIRYNAGQPILGSLCALQLCSS